MTKASEVPGVADAAAWIDQHYGQHLNRQQSAEIAVGVARALWQPITGYVLAQLADRMEGLGGDNEQVRDTYRAVAEAIREGITEGDDEPKER